MTAEVVIMNKKGLSLAADSAITSGRDGIQKVYNSANKLFSLSGQHPVGLMIYGAASFMEVPWDVIIKSYRDYLGEKKYENLTDYAEGLMQFLNEDERFKNKEIESIIVDRTYSDKLKQIVKEVEEKMEQHPNEEHMDNRIHDWLTERTEAHLKRMKKMETVYLDIRFLTFKKAFHPLIKEITTELITHPISGQLEKKLCELAFETVKKDFFSAGSSGIVICGYGEKEIFPHLLNYRLEGFVFGQLKYKKLKERKISYTSDKKDGTASISAFGQTEMVDSFLLGMEPNMADAVFGIINKVFLNYYEQINKHTNIDLTNEQVTSLEKLGKEVYTSINEAVDEYQQQHYMNPLLGVVRSLPIEELAEMTEALVNLTSFKRRVTRATESVGPPVDVAVISKGDGFVWVKRKNYIDPQINYRWEGGG
ncbi:hypothetical protein [Virgibacillus kimchii]